MSGEGWIVARTKAQRESWAAENVARQGYVFYYPRVARRVRGKLGRLMVAEPLFPRYLFVKARNNWHPLLSTFGLAGVVMTAESPSLMPDKVIDELRSREDPTSGLVVLPRLSEGQTVRVRRGPFGGQSGIYQGSSSIDRERVLLDFLGRKTMVLIARDLLEVV